MMAVWKADGDNMGALVSGIDTDDVPIEYIIPYTPKISLRPHQIQTFNLMVQRDSLLIADQEGVGKTPPILCSHEAKIQMGVAKWGLFVTKASLTYDVYNQAKKFTNMNVKVLGGSQKKRLDMYYELEKSTDIDLVVVSYELFRQDIDLLITLHAAKPFDIMYCDEVHKTKNILTSQVGQDIHKIYCSQHYAITATPIINELMDCYNILAWMGVMPYNFFHFQNKFCTFGDYGKINGYKNVGEFKALLQPNMLRRLKTQVLDLPPVISKPIYVELTAAQKKLYKEVELADANYEFEDLEFEDIPSELAKYARLSQVAESTEIVGGAKGKIGSAKLIQLEELLEEIVARGEKLVVFSRSKRFVHIMYNYFKKYNPAIMTGDVSSQAKDDDEVSERQKQVDKFQENESCKVIFCCESASREGWTGTAANNVCFTSKPWSPAYVSQCVGRVFRFGQDGGTTGTINVYSLIACGTIDEHIEQLLEEKQFVISAAVEQPLSTKQILSILRGEKAA
ncbi:DEAD/DEAH box helicase [Brevibacillus laterosporus]|uniref:DEAD/DEAH box helicase n=1 Tax=Brevibacillus laterosporus TaxID=1465 RepID=UPI003D1D0FEA